MKTPRLAVATAALAAAALATVTSRCSAQTPTSLQLVNHTLGESSGTAARADLPRGHSVALEVAGVPGAPVLLFLSTTPPPVSPPQIGGMPVAVDPATAALVVDGRTSPGAVIGASGTFSLAFSVPAGLPLGLELWLQALTFVPPTQTPELSAGLVLTVIDAHRFDFENGAQGWVGGFADYPVGQEEFYELSWGPAPLPAPIAGGAGVRMVGNNHSDDLFMFLARRVDGLVPGARYAVTAEVRLASQYPASALGVGGAPGSGVYLHAGASTQQPKAVVQPGRTLPWYVMNIQKGNQATGGAESAVLGDIGIPGSQFVYQLITRKGTQPVVATADAGGGLWLHVGTDSGFEAKTDIVYDELVFRIRAQ